MRTPTINEPFRAMRKLEREMNRLFEDFYTSPTSLSQGMEESVYNPVCEVDETKDHYLMSFELPGVAKEDVSVEVCGNELCVTGERSKEHMEESKHRSLEEREFGKYETVFTLPIDANTEKLEANYRDGVLRVAIPRAEAKKGHKIKIGDAKPGWWNRLLEKGEMEKAA